MTENDVPTDVHAVTETGEPGDLQDEKRRRNRWIIGLLLLLLLLVCLCVVAPTAQAMLGGRSGGILDFLRSPTRAPLPTDTATVTSTSTPTDIPTATDAVSATPTETDTPGDTPTDKPTMTATKKPTATVEPTKGTCEVIPGDGICDVRCENTDLDSQDCTCNQDNKCDPGEGLNCPDCSYGQCGTACGSDADCHNPGLECVNGLCFGPVCSGGSDPGGGNTGGGGSCPCRCIRVDPKTGKCLAGQDCNGKSCMP